MKQAVKEYLAVTPSGCKMFQLVILPVLSILWIIGSYYLFGSRGGNWGYLIEFAGLVPVLEIICDYWRFGGFCNKHTNHIEYFMFAGKCKEVIYRILMIDIIRKISMIAGVFLIGYMFVLFEPGIKINMENFGRMCGMILLVYTFSILGSVIVRYTTQTTLALCVGSICSYSVLLCVMYFNYFPKEVFLLSGLFSLIGSVVCIRMCMGKVEKSFYDKED